MHPSLRSFCRGLCLLAVLSVLTQPLHGCSEPETSADAHQPAAMSQSPKVGVDTKLKWRVEMRPESTGELLRRSGTDKLGSLIKVEIDYKDGSKGLKQFSSLGSVEKVRLTFKDGSFMESAPTPSTSPSVVHVFDSKAKMTWMISTLNGKVKAQVFPESGESYAFERQTGTTERVLYWPDGKTPRLKANAEETNKFQVFRPDGTLNYVQEVKYAQTNIPGGTAAETVFYRPDGKTPWYSQVWVFFNGQPYLYSAKEFEDNTGRLVKELQAKAGSFGRDDNAPEGFVKAVMELTEFGSNGKPSLSIVDSLLLDKGRALPAPGAVVPQEDLLRLVSRPADNLVHLMKMVSRNDMPDVSRVLQLLAEKG